jgi:hypothetical protein
MKIELSQFTPYFLFFFGIVITYIGWSTKKILENIEHAIKSTAQKVDIHEHNLSEIISIIKIHDMKIESLAVDIDDLRRNQRP